MSYPNGSGGTLTLPSPTHIHSVRSLRKAIARSPSRARQASTTPAGSPQSLSSLAVSLSQRPLGEGSTPLKPSERLSTRSLRPARPVNRPLSRSRMSQKSPLRRCFGSHRDSGNPLPPSVSAPEARPRCGSPSSRSPSPIASPVASPVHHTEVTLIMDHATLDSPLPKRRSLGLRADLLDDPPATSHPFDTDDDAPKGYELRSSTRRTTSPQDSVASPDISSLPKRTTSLRKSTLQQRHDDQRISLGRRVGEKQLNQASKAAAPATSTTRTRPRLSLDQYLPPDDRGSPFTQAPLPSASVHPLPRPPAQRHPLSRTITQSSSGSSLPDESPTHPPVSLGEKPRVPLNFSRSLPLGARPLGAKIPPPVATPKYKRAKPFQAAFMSTGLVSKMNRNPEAGPPKRPGDSSEIMPDTPCKKQPYDSSTFPPKPLGSARRPRLSFGTATTPLPDASSTPRGSPFAPQDRSASLFFKQIRGNNLRRASLLSFEGEDAGDSPESDDFPPPTPTKSLFKSQSTPAHPQQAQMTPTATRFTHSASAFGIGKEHSTPSSSFGFTSPLGRHSNGQTDRPTTADGELLPVGIKDSPRMSQSLPSFTMRRGRGNSFTTPAPVKTNPTIVEASEKHTPDSASPVNPRNPKTPSETMGPPDGNFLSISNARKGNIKFARSPSTPTTLVGPGLPSATPEGQPLTKGQNRRISSTPQNVNAPSNVDEALYSRFDKAEVIGGGAFSQVYRVVQRSTMASFSSFTSTPGRHTPEVEKVFAVKKIAFFGHGEKQRESKMREVNVLKALSTSDKIVHYVDSWEQNGCLYIQTEYCTEGSLDAFLREVGQNGRMDDFRIWKTLLELSQGLSAIHSAGFIHLDLKPANIFIGFDGYLKIGDFGFAVPWPAPKGVEGEGDREYIGPEILLGQYDKPADIFALGLIILEIACNVYLPDNGPTWQALRNGDLTVVPSLTSSDAGGIIRDAQISTDDGDLSAFSSVTYDPSNLFGAQKRSELQEPPRFMMDANDPHSLDSVVRWMIQPEPANRPTAEALLKVESVDWVACRRTAGATVYEGNWGLETASTTEQFDTTMTDV
ncbi:hypothetical protein NEUTE1DRAFT_127160 [Neurospora tetrasperma FGSC 2508]|uniref:Protein kinase domain-containing protein n=1 Tax=Neurospora tetrasperma (strain FGSC 2508 / ATCC MYA-4615 / P0657) TaxID=510951 RepID=F8MB71_NEUT8|nr:uncharacterized protein NEUTE1DRAFT_127160 [Neurospora tetrasperma FGSC 2508]EGO60236.1 hypothetical protein NEUTE1DRAFT_127160 [Neurospora tetrasperma FGSC 2508]EGZ75802.1 kinase-like protein [Neurospora tetrasperma FGSC 2509]